nr:MAG TPA: hypothetical protein [Caudoviricetes sp.]
MAADLEFNVISRYRDTTMWCKGSLFYLVTQNI